MSVSTMELEVDGENSSINISDVIEVIKTDPAFGSSVMEGTPRRGLENNAPRIKILEQPASKALRFRYECEGRSAGSIPGVNSTPENKTFPTIQIENYQGRAVVVVSCVTKDLPYRPHPHNLVGKEGCKKGVCTMEVSSETMTATFANLGIQCIKKKDIEDALKTREEMRIDPFRTGFAYRNQPGTIDLNAVRLCFQAFLEGPQRNKFTQPLMPVVSEPIYDKKAMSDLVICKLSECSASVAGGKEIILLCEKVAKEDISVRLYEEQNGQMVWEGHGDFTPTQVHKQVAIAFRTPRYKALDVTYPVQVSIQLRRPSDGATSEPLPFLLTPLDADPVKRKRQKTNNPEILRHLQDSDQQLKPSTNPFQNTHMYIPPGKLSPIYASRTPSPAEYGAAAAAATSMAYISQPAYNAGITSQTLPYQAHPAPFSPSPPMQVAVSPQMNHLKMEPQQMVQQMNLRTISPQNHSVMPMPQQPQAINNLNVATVVNTRLADGGGSPEVNNFLDMDTQQHHSIELNINRLDSKDLADLENLSSNLTLLEKDAPRMTQANENMTDSLTGISTSSLFLGDNFSMENLYPGAGGGC